MATANFNLSSSSPAYQCKDTTKCFISSTVSSLSFPHSTLSCSSIRSSRVFRLLAVAEEETAVVEAEEKAAEEAEDTSPKPKVKPCQLYVCNLPRSCDDAQLLEIFKPFGDVQSVEISRNAESGISKGCGYVTMSSVPVAIPAIIALDGSDVGGREMRVKFSEDMNRKKNIEALDVKNKTQIFETPHKIYVGNLPWSIKPEFLREYFTQFGTVVSVRVLYDRKTGKNRVYGFISFSSDEQVKAAMSSNGTELLARKIVVRSALKSAEFQK
ncbi:hypothetical protein ACHQM5_000010 [Ranunculus cassubicifolius]